MFKHVKCSTVCIFIFKGKSCVSFIDVSILCWMQVCDSDTMLDPASSVEMVKVLEEDPMVGGVGGDVQVCVLLQF